MMLYYYPSCTFRKALPDTAKLVIDYLKPEMQIMGCCRADRADHDPSDTAVVICQSCRDTVESKINVISLWEYLLQTGFSFPDYSGLTVNVQDCWRERNQPEVRMAIRTILKRMNIQIVETPLNGRDADFCGTWHYEVKNPELAAEIAKYPSKSLYALPVELQQKVMAERSADYSCEYVVCGCATCYNGIRLGGIAKGIHLLELLFQTAQF